MRLTAFHYGTTELPEDQIFAGGDPAAVRPIALLFFLIEVGERRILVDTGCDTMPGFTLFTHAKPVEVLAQRGLAPEAITDVVLTHHHHDHSDGLRYYPQARLYIHPAERKRLPIDHPGEVIEVADVCDIAPGVSMQVIGGHSQGSAVVQVQDGAHIWVLCGDECYSADNLRQQIPTGVSCCAAQSQRFVEEYSRPMYKPLVFHDLAVLDTIGFRVLAGEA